MASVLSRVHLARPGPGRYVPSPRRDQAPHPGRCRGGRFLFRALRKRAPAVVLGLHNTTFLPGLTHCVLRLLPAHPGRPLPGAPVSFLQWLDVLVTKLAGRTVTVAISAIVAWSALNNLAHPIDTNPVLRQAWRGLVRTRSVRVGPQKLPLSEVFVLSVFPDFGATTASCLALTSSCCVQGRVGSLASSPHPVFGRLVCGPFATSGRSRTFRRSCDS